jgi:hypothetical protein
VGFSCTISKAFGPLVTVRVAGGGRGIRTPGTVSGTVVFKTTRFNRSRIPPHCSFNELKILQHNLLHTALRNYTVSACGSCPHAASDGSSTSLVALCRASLFQYSVPGRCLSSCAPTSSRASGIFLNEKPPPKGRGRAVPCRQNVRNGGEEYANITARC